MGGKKTKAEKVKRGDGRNKTSRKGKKGARERERPLLKNKEEKEKHLLLLGK